MSGNPETVQIIGTLIEGSYPSVCSIYLNSQRNVTTGTCPIAKYFYIL
jgi:predicted AlkP superfamily pyrophosphatase or phosphodiesterase